MVVSRKRFNSKLYLLILVLVIMAFPLFFYFIQRGTKNSSSSEFAFYWDSQSKQAIVKQNNSALFNFELLEKPKSVWLYKPLNILSLVTYSNGDKGPDNIYIFNNNELKKIYSGQTYKVNQSITDSERIDNLKFSPKGDFIFANILGYESADPIIFSINSSKFEIRKFPLGDLYWSSNNDCVLGINGYGMYGPSFQIGKNNLTNYLFTELKAPQDLIDFFVSTKTKVYWNKECSGVIYLENEKGENGYYGFDLKQNNLTKFNINPILNDYQESLKVDQEKIYSSDK